MGGLGWVFGLHKSSDNLSEKKLFWEYGFPNK